MPQTRLVPGKEWFNANRIMKPVLEPGTAHDDVHVLTANNDVNVLKATNAIPGGIAMNHYFTAPHAWFIRTNCPNGMKMYQRVGITFEQDNDFDTDNAKAKSRERYSFLWTDPRGLFGSNG